MASQPTSAPTPASSLGQLDYKSIPSLSNLPPLPSLPNLANPHNSPLDHFRLAISEQVSKTLDLPLDFVFGAVQNPAKGADFSVAVPRFRLKGKPDQYAQKVQEEFQPNAYLSSCEAKGAFVLYHMNTVTLTSLTLSICHHMTYGPKSVSASDSKSDSDSDSEKTKLVSSYGTNLSGQGKDIIVEFSSPNIAKPFHAGHLRSTIIGAFVANLYEANGWNVERWNYLGDWGKQFGLLAVGWKLYGDEEKLKENAVMHLYDVYVKINKLAEEQSEGVDKEGPIHQEARAYFKGMEDGDEECLKMWEKFRVLSIEQYVKTYERLNIKFDHYSGESQVKKENMKKTMDLLNQSDFVSEEKGAKLIDLTKFKLEKTVVERKDGTPLYITRDIAEAKQRWDKFGEKGFDKMIYVVACQQDLHLAQFFKVLELLGYPWAQPKEEKLLHLNFGMVKGMSTRKGTAVFLDHILDEAKNTMWDLMKENKEKYALIENPEQTADIVGMTAVKIQDMSAKRINDYTFDWKRMTSWEGDTGPYLQYQHVRLCSVERKLAADGISLKETDLDISSLKPELLSEEKAREIVVLLASWPDVVRNAIRDHQPSTIVTYSFRLCHAISSAWETLIVKGSQQDVALIRLWLFRCSRNVLSAALRLLTVQPLERM